jgi:hypothetical protein
VTNTIEGSSVHSHRLTTSKLRTRRRASALHSSFMIQQRTTRNIPQCDIPMALPNKFSISRAPKSSSWSKTKTYHLGTPDAPQLYTCKEVVAWSGKATISLHTGSTAESDPIASSASESAWRTDTTVTIPISAASTTSPSTSSEINGPLRKHTSFTHETWNFICPIDFDGERQVEQFEWRRSHGDETASLRDGKSTYGWKLIRLHSNNEPNPVSSDSTVSGHSSNGKEIVAVWTDDSLTWFRGMDKGVVGKFEFIGTSGGQMGEQWKLFAVVSALHMRQVGLQQAQSTASSAAVNA